MVLVLVCDAAGIRQYCTTNPPPTPSLPHMPPPPPVATFIRPPVPFCHFLPLLICILWIKHWDLSLTKHIQRVKLQSYLMWFPKKCHQFYKGTHISLISILSKSTITVSEIRALIHLFPIALTVSLQSRVAVIQCNIQHNLYSSSSLTWDAAFKAFSLLWSLSVMPLSIRGKALNEYAEQVGWLH